MSQLKRYACQVGKVILGIPLVAAGVAAVLIGAALLSEFIVYLLVNFVFIQIVAICAVCLLLLVFAYVVGDIVFRKYDICQRFK